MTMRQSIVLLGILALAAPLVALAAEPAWWTQQKKQVWAIFEFGL